MTKDSSVGVLLKLPTSTTELTKIWSIFFAISTRPKGPPKCSGLERTSPDILWEIEVGEILKLGQMNDYFVVDLFCWWLKSSNGKSVVWGPVVSRILGVFLSSNPFHKSINPSHQFTISWSKGSNSLRTFALGWSNHILQTWWFIASRTNKSVRILDDSVKHYPSRNILGCVKRRSYYDRGH